MPIDDEHRLLLQATHARWSERPNTPPLPRRCTYMLSPELNLLLSITGVEHTIKIIANKVAI
jgi:hypothetical protein